MDTYKVNGVAVVKYPAQQPSNKAPVIMVHGGDHGSWGWQNWAQLFSQDGYDVHVLDWYNHGESDKLPQQEFIKRSIADVAHKEIKHVVDKLGRTPILIGHSMGGLATAVYAASADVERLVLVAPVMPSAAQPDPVPLPVDPTQPFLVPPYVQAKQMFFTKSTDADAKRYYDLLVPESAQAVLEATQWTVNFDVSSIKAPTMVVGVEFDQLIPAAPLQRYANMLGATFVQISGIGHSDVLLKDPEWRDAAKQVLQWLDQS